MAAAMNHPLVSGVDLGGGGGGIVIVPSDTTQQSDEYYNCYSTIKGTGSISKRKARSP